MSPFYKTSRVLREAIEQNAALRAATLEDKRRRLLAVHKANPEFSPGRLAKRFNVPTTWVRKWLEGGT